MVIEITKNIYSVAFYVYILIGSISLGTAVIYYAKPNSFPEEKLRKKILDSTIMGIAIIGIALAFDILISGFDKVLVGEGLYPVVLSFSFFFAMFFWKAINPHDYKLGDVIEEPKTEPEEKEMNLKVEILKGSKKEKPQNQNLTEVSLEEVTTPVKEKTNEKDDILTTKKINIEKEQEEPMLVEKTEVKEKTKDSIQELELKELEKALEDESREPPKPKVETLQEEIKPQQYFNEKKKLPDTIIVEAKESVDILKSRKEKLEEQKPPWVKDLEEIKQSKPIEQPKTQEKPKEEVKPPEPKKEEPKTDNKKKDDFDSLISNLRKWCYMSKILEKIALALQIPFKDKIKAAEEDSKKEELPKIDLKIPEKSKEAIREEERTKKIIELRKKQDEFNTMVQDVYTESKKAEKQETKEPLKTGILKETIPTSITAKPEEKPKETDLTQALKQISEKPSQSLFENKTHDTPPTKQEELEKSMKIKCPNCHKETLKTYDCPYCNKEFCAKCAKSIDITEDGFEYKCPNCNKRVFVPKDHK